MQACLRGWAHGNRRTVVLRRCGDKLFCAGRTRSYEPLTLPAVTRCQLGCLFHSPGNPWNFFSFSRLVPAVGFQQGTSMPLYRAYLIHKGQVWTAVDLNCTDDADARQQAESLLNGHDVELWQRDRRIALLISKDSPVASPITRRAFSLAFRARETFMTRWVSRLKPIWRPSALRKSWLPSFPALVPTYGAIPASW